MPAACSSNPQHGAKVHDSELGSIEMDVVSGSENVSSIVSNKTLTQGKQCIDTMSVNSKRRRCSLRDDELPQDAATKKQLFETDDNPKTKVALVSRTRELILEDLDELLSKLFPRLDRTLNSNFVPKFNGRGVASGRIWFECTNMESRSWLERQIKDITDTWSRGSLDIIEWIPTSPLQRVCLSVPWRNEERTPAALVISRLDNLNPHLGIKRWHLFKATKPWEGKRLFIFGLDIESLNLLEDNEFNVFYAFGRLTAFKYNKK